MNRTKFKNIWEVIKVTGCCFFPFTIINKMTIYNYCFEINLNAKNKIKIKKRESFDDYNYRMIKEIKRYHSLNNAKNILTGKKDYYNMQVFKITKKIKDLESSSMISIINIFYTFIGICTPFIIMYYQTLINSLQRKVDLDLNNLVIENTHRFEDISKYYNEVTKIVEGVGEKLSIFAPLVFGIAIILIGYLQVVYKKSIEIRLSYYENSLFALNDLKKQQKY